MVASSMLILPSLFMSPIKKSMGFFATGSGSISHSPQTLQRVPAVEPPFHIGGGHSGNRFINVIQCRNFLLCNNNFSAHGAMTSLGQACMSAARRNGFVNDSSVSVGGNNLLRFENFMTLSALLAVSQACFRTSRSVSGDRLYHSMVTADGYGERSAGFSKIIEVSEVELQLNGRHTACTKGNSIIAVVNSRSCFTAFLEHAAKVVSPITIDQKHKLTQNGLGYFREHDFPNIITNLRHLIFKITGIPVRAVEPVVIAVAHHINGMVI